MQKQVHTVQIPVINWKIGCQTPTQTLWFFFSHFLHIAINRMELSRSLVYREIQQFLNFTRLGVEDFHELVLRYMYYVCISFSNQFSLWFDSLQLLSFKEDHKWISLSCIPVFFLLRRFDLCQFFKIQKAFALCWKYVFLEFFYLPFPKVLSHSGSL